MSGFEKIPPARKKITEKLIEIIGGACDGECSVERAAEKVLEYCEKGDDLWVLLNNSTADR